MRDKALKILAVSITLLMVVSSVASCIAVVANSTDADSDFREFEENFSEVERYSEQPFERAVNKNDSRSAVILSSNTIYVPDDYAKIQWAVDNASAGDTIIVKDGTYIENVAVNKSLTITSESGAETTIVQAADSTDHVFEVTADYVNISGFTVEGATGGYHAGAYAGIFLYYADQCNLSCNNCSNNYCGIYFYDSNDNTITGNSVSNNDWDGISLISSSNNNIIGNTFVNDGLFVFYSYQNTVKDNIVNGKPLVYLEDKSDLTIADAGQVILVNCDNITIENLNLSNASIGVELWNTDNSTIKNNTANCNVYGIYLNYYSNNNILSNNTVLNNLDGICLDDSSSNIVTNNLIKSNNRYGVDLGYSNNITLTNNTFVNNGIFVGKCYRNTVEDNTVNGKPLVYLEDEFDLRIADAGQVILIGCSNITVENLNLSDASVGVELWETINSKITSNIASNNYWGIYLGYYSNNNTIANNIASNNYDGIILFSSSNNNTLTGNTANSNDEHGILLYSSNNILTNNIASNNSCGIRLTWADNNTLMNTTALNNNLGICLSQSSNNNTLMSNMASNNDYGIYLSQSSDNTLTNNTASNNSYGIYLWSWNYYNTFTNNTASNNNYGIALHHSSNNNIIHLNNFINNTDNVYSYKSTNIWNSTEKVNYTYNGSTYTNYLGNYWSDYIFEGNDTNGDGIGDTPYSIDSDEDNYPLMVPWENYFAPTENVFDTGKPANPYPSIMGTHNGTITPLCNVNVSRMYTVPCAGTGGHTEYAKIYNDSFSIDTLPWEGYQRDWYNLSFSKSFKLYANVEYNYTIKTGSYPQIHHNTSLLITNGWINCTEFVDANGEEYDDWIPAIKLD